MTSEPKPATKPHRLWPRFTLRVFLAVITLLAIGLGWWTHRAREQRRVVQALQRLERISKLVFAS
ncbi:MAG: hypothetical protein SFU86_21955 [Pirellulaceae bacterium]|nr:hypothetical protein [Pirellulaceae bacterium]